MPIVEDYLSYTKKWKQEYGEKTLVLMQVGTFFEVYALVGKDGQKQGSNIDDFARINDMVISRNARSCVEGLPVVMAGFGLPQLDKYVGKLQEAGYTLAIYTQDVQAKNTTRSLAEIVSPGTFFSLDNTQLSNNIMCVWLHRSKANKIMSSKMTVGLANIDILTGRTSVFQFSSDYYHNPCTYDELERYVTIYNPRECIIVSNIEESLVDDIVEFASIDCPKLHKITTDGATKVSGFARNAEKQIYQRETLRRFYPQVEDDVLLQSFSEHFIAVQSFTFLLDYVYQHNPNLVLKLSPPVFENYTDRLILANHSLKQLNIIDDSRHTGKLRSVGAMLNCCMTTMGKRRFNYSINNPSTNTKALDESYSVTEHLLSGELWTGFRERLVGVKDLEKLSRKLVIGKTSPKDFAMLFGDLETAVTLHKTTRQDKCVSGYVDSFENGDISLMCKEMMTRLSDTFDIEKCALVEDVSIEKLSALPSTAISFVRKGVSEPIDSLMQSCLDSRAKLEAIRSTFSDIVKKVEKNTKTTAFVKIHETPKTDPSLVGTARRITLLENQITKHFPNTCRVTYESAFSKTMESFEVKTSDLEYKSLGSNKKDLTVTNSQIRQISTDIQTSKDRLVNAIVLFYKKFIDEFVEFREHMECVIRYITTVDTMQCKCYVAHKYNYCRPKIVDAEKAFVSFKGIRHPLIEHIQTNELYVTNDLDIGKGTDGVLLYGTNAVGKTSLIKSIGISVVMAQAGMYVPCSSFEFYPYSSLFTRILGNDNIFKGLSTFAVEMSELRTILTLSDKNSLILGDELCSGTESDSALSIFTTGLEMLHDNDSSFLFATHFHEINNYEEIRNLRKLKMMHMAVTYSPEKDVLVYDRKLRDGPGQSMYGLEVCKSLHLPTDFLQRAHDIRMKYKPENRNTLSMGASHYNAQKLKGMCELCGAKEASEVHHLQHQSEASENNSYISSFHKNHKANLLNVCDGCHDRIHKSGRQHRVAKTTGGYEIMDIK